LLGAPVFDRPLVSSGVSLVHHPVVEQGFGESQVAAGESEVVDALLEQVLLTVTIEGANADFEEGGGFFFGEDFVIHGDRIPSIL
jgi:hypothetical protein